VNTEVPTMMPNASYEEEKDWVSEANPSACVDEAWD
jgi:hypothetical protein